METEKYGEIKISKYNLVYFLLWNDVSSRQIWAILHNLDKYHNMLMNSKMAILNSLTEGGYIEEYGIAKP